MFIYLSLLILKKFPYIYTYRKFEHHFGAAREEDVFLVLGMSGKDWIPLQTIDALLYWAKTI